jgi:hypothetical protein
MSEQLGVPQEPHGAVQKSRSVRLPDELLMSAHHKQLPAPVMHQLVAALAGGRTSNVTDTFAQPPVVVAPPLLVAAMPPEDTKALATVVPPLAALLPLPPLASYATKPPQAGKS